MKNLEVTHNQIGLHLQKLLRTEAKPEAKPRLAPKISGNDYCPCRSKKFKKCAAAPP